MSKKHTEIRFEEAIEEFLVSTKQYEKGDPKDYDVETALFPQDVFAFLEKSQSKYLDAVKELRKERIKDLPASTLQQKES
jgi:type I restriction enzyme R subunit